jgi:hypothetical protein
MVRGLKAVMLLLCGVTLMMSGCRTASPNLTPQRPVDPVVAYDAGRELVAAGHVVEAWPLFQHAMIHGEEGLRRQAAIELYELGVALFDEDGEDCQVIDLSAGCGQALLACSNRVIRDADGIRRTEIQLAIGYEVEALRFEDNRIEDSEVARLVWHAIEECDSEACELRERLRCEVVFADACDGRVAAVCEHGMEEDELDGFEANLETLADGTEVLVFELGWPEEE